MELDKTTYNDLSIFHSEEEFSLFHKLNFCRTGEGREWLYRNFTTPFSTLRQIEETQDILKSIVDKLDGWPSSISNGTIMVLVKYFDTNFDVIPSGANLMNAFSYKVFHSADFSLVKYSMSHFADFLRGMKHLTDLFDDESAPGLLKSFLTRARELMSRRIVQELSARPPAKDFTWQETIYFGKFTREHYRSETMELIGIFGRLDAWYSMAVATQRLGLTFPKFLNQANPYIDARELYHLLLGEPVPYDVHMNKESNFIFLTGANMAGKSTFIRAVGTAVFMAHLGMGVPAREMVLTMFDGLLSNINVVDNIARGESYFFNEVQRIKNTILKINDKRKWLVLIDELFKGTNVQDAMKCSLTVIKGLLKIRNSVFILSTHLYEIGHELKDFTNISFKYFETGIQEDQLQFSYQLKEGVSNDRIGYVILRREKVVEMLERL
jgi:DNA mismatch repair protein MutS